MSTRDDSHSGTWYTDNGTKLAAQMDKWLSDVKTERKSEPCIGLVGPHAGFTYSGPTAAHAYKHMDPSRVKRVFVLGPSHHYYTPGCEVTAFSAYKTPVGDIKVDATVTQALLETKRFKKMKPNVDEDEHSIEMHLPYIAHVMKNRSYTLVPILVGSLSVAAEQEYGKILAPYLADPSNFFVISSDFCHWGSRFRFTFYDKSKGPIWKSIEALDKLGIELIETLNAKAFANYLSEYRNTICGRHPIGVFLNAIQVWKQKKVSMKFVSYAQSSRCFTGSDSSVSYAAGVCHVCPPKTGAGSSN